MKTEIEQYLFHRAHGIISTDIAPNITKIGKAAFRECYDLVVIDIPDSINEIEDEAFAFCENVQYAKLSSNLKYLNNSVLR